MNTTWPLIGSGWALWFGGLICHIGGQHALSAWLFGFAVVVFIAAAILGWMATR